MPGDIDSMSWLHRFSHGLINPMRKLYYKISVLILQQLSYVLIPFGIMVQSQVFLTPHSFSSRWI